MFESLKVPNIKEVMGDGAKAISKAKENVGPTQNSENGENPS